MTTNLSSFSLAQLFGEGAYQDASVLVIQKSSLRLTASTTNTAESLLVAILINCLQNFQGIITDENNQAITDENNQPIAFNNLEAFELLRIFQWNAFQIARNNQKYIRNQVIVEVYSANQ